MPALLCSSAMAARRESPPRRLASCRRANHIDSVDSAVHRTGIHPLALPMLALPMPWVDGLYLQHATLLFQPPEACVAPLQCRSAQELTKAGTVCYTAATVALNVSFFLRPGELDLVANPPWTRVSTFMSIFTFFDGVRAAPVCACAVSLLAATSTPLWRLYKGECCCGWTRA